MYVSIMYKENQSILNLPQKIICTKYFDNEFKISNSEQIETFWTAWVWIILYCFTAVYEFVFCVQLSCILRQGQECLINVCIIGLCVYIYTGIIFPSLNLANIFYSIPDKHCQQVVRQVGKSHALWFIHKML